MTDLSWSHILIVVIVALVVIGPRDLPRFMRMAGNWIGKARAMADQFRKSFDEMARQSELDELRAELNALREHAPPADAPDIMLPPDMISEPETQPSEPADAASEPPADAGHAPPLP